MTAKQKEMMMLGLLAAFFLYKHKQSSAKLVLAEKKLDAVKGIEADGELVGSIKFLV